MKVIGIVGGIGAGKSTIIALMNEIKPIHSISADLIGHEILKKGQAGYAPTLAAFGTSILDEQGEIIRKKLGEIVFKEPKKIVTLNEITHPLITQEIKQRIDHYKQIAPQQHIIIEAALLIESGLACMTDVVIGVYAELRHQTVRVQKRDGLSQEQISQRVKAQQTWNELKEQVDYIIDNRTSLEETKRQIIQILTVLEEEVL